MPSRFSVLKCELMTIWIQFSSGLRPAFSALLTTVVMVAAALL